MSAFDTYRAMRDSTLRNGEAARAEEQQNALLTTRQQAGNALAGGDYSGAGNALFQGGDLSGGLQVMGAQRTQQATEREMSLANDARAKTEVLGYAQGLLRLPEDQWAPTFTTQIAPRLVAMGIPQATIDQTAADGLTRQEVEYFINTLGGEVQRPTYQAAGNGQFMRSDPYGTGEPEFIQAPIDPQQARLLEAQIRAQEALAGQRQASGQAATTRAARSGRSGGGSRSSGGTAPRRSYSPSAIQWD